jgi:transcriptional accessory protein Tex/SPT6
MLFQTAAKASSIESLKRLTQGSFSHGTVRRQTARKAVATCVALQSFPLHHAA